MSMYVGNISYQTTEDDLGNLFAEFGEVSSVKIIRDRESGRSKGFGFVEMNNDSEANDSIHGLNGCTFMDRPLVVNEARPRQNRRNDGYRI